MRPHLTNEQRFWRQIEKTETCWLWSGAQHGFGYGIFRMSRPRGQRYAHRYAWELLRGPIPRGMCVLHDCPDGKDEPRCVNPDHLWLGTKAENNHDRDSKSRGRWAYGARHYKAKLNADIVRSIRRDLGHRTQRAIAAELGVSFTTINAIALGRAWKHVV